MDRDKKLVLQVVRPMLDRYAKATDAVKGDFLYLFGELKATESLSLLQQAAAEDPNEEIKEAAAEALEKIASDRELQ